MSLSLFRSPTPIPVFSSRSRERPSKLSLCNFARRGRGDQNIYHYIRADIIMMRIEEREIKCAYHLWAEYFLKECLRLGTQIPFCLASRNNCQRNCRCVGETKCYWANILYFCFHLRNELKKILFNRFRAIIQNCYFKRV